MDYGNPKVLPTTGGGIILAGSLMDQLMVSIGIAITVVIVAVLIRTVWRRRRNIRE